MASVRQRQRRALAAGGTVLGIGAVLVAAGWTDTVLGSTEFATGSQFGIESSVDGGSMWSSRPIGAPNPLAFTTTATGMIPGSVVFAPVELRTEAGSAAASVTLQGAAFSGSGVGSLSVALRYRVVRESAGCDAAAFTGSPNYVVGSGGPVSLDTSAPVAFPLPAGAGPTLAGPAVPLCFEVSLPATQENWTDATLQSKSLVANWPFEGTS